MAVQWHPVLDQALAETSVVGVADAVTHHLGRRPTKSEITAARRAAHRYAATGQAQLTLLPSVAAGRKHRVLVLARPDVDLDDVQELRRAVAAPAKRAAKLICSDRLSSGHGEAPPGWVRGGASLRLVDLGLTGRVRDAGQADIRGLVTAGRCCSAGAVRLSKVERRPIPSDGRLIA